jgi:hypothetical protein
MTDVILAAEGVSKVHVIGVGAVQNPGHVFGEYQFFVGGDDEYLDR